MSVVIFGMVYNTAVSVFYVFVIRYSNISGMKGRLFIIVTMIVAYIVSFIGFTDLIGIFSSLIGYAGLILITMFIYAPFRLKKLKANESVRSLIV